MIDKVKQIRAEVERLKNENTGSPISVCDDIIAFIDSLQEEPVSNPIDFEKELYKAFGQVKDFTLGMQIAKRFYNMGRFDAHIQDGDKIAINEDGVRTNISRLHRIAKKYGPINNDLWEAAQIYYEELQKEKFEGSDVIDAYYAGAKRQKEQDKETIELAEDHAMLAGMEKMREQMMKNAVEEIVDIDSNGLACINVDGYLPGDKVRVYIFKEE